MYYQVSYHTLDTALISYIWNSSVTLLPQLLLPHFCTLLVAFSSLRQNTGIAMYVLI